MNLKILYDSEVLREGLASGWGFSCLIEGRVLFDTGESGELLKQNIDIMKINLSELEAVVISHDHWDHVGGLEYVARQVKNLKIYICPGFDAAFKEKISALPAKIIEIDNFFQVSSCIYTTGQITGIYKDKEIAEQALILQTGRRFSVITGCAHPGIVKILKKVKSQLGLEEFYAVIGGFHLKNNSLVENEQIVQEFLNLKVRRVGPLHCTGPEAAAVFQKVYQDRCRLLKIGEEMEV